MYKTLLRITQEDLTMWIDIFYALKFQRCKNVIVLKMIYNFKAIQNKVPAAFFKKSVETDQPNPTFL